MAQLPFKYLGVPLSDKKLTVADWGYVIDTISKKLQGWIGNLLSIGGRLTFLNSVLTAMPLYELSLYKMPTKVIKQIDQVRLRFLWQGNSGPRKKYSLLNWTNVCYPKAFGALGVEDIAIMNKALLMKWWWKWKHPHHSGLWKQVIQLKYNSHTPLTQVSPLWREVVKLQTKGQLSCSYQLGCGTDIKFWLDVWPLRAL